jgi:hypothetical protein
MLRNITKSFGRLFEAGAPKKSFCQSFLSSQETTIQRMPQEIYRINNFPVVPSINEGLIEIEQPIYECKNKRAEQARRKRLKRKNGTNNKVRWK